MNDSQAYKPVVVKGFLVVKFFSLGFHYPKIMCLKKKYTCIESDYRVSQNVLKIRSNYVHFIFIFI